MYVSITVHCVWVCVEGGEGKEVYGCIQSRVHALIHCVCVSIDLKRMYACHVRMLCVVVYDMYVCVT